MATLVTNYCGSTLRIKTFVVEARILTANRVKMKRSVYLEIIDYMQSLGPRCNLHQVAELFPQ